MIRMSVKFEYRPVNYVRRLATTLQKKRAPVEDCRAWNV